MELSLKYRLNAAAYWITTPPSPSQVGLSTVLVGFNPGTNQYRRFHTIV